MPGNSRSFRLSGALIVAVLLVVIVAVVVVGFVAAGASATRTTSSPSVAVTPSASASPTASASATPTATASPSRPVKRAPSAAPSPQPTRSAAIASKAPITRTVTAEVTKTEAVEGKAEGPGEISGPAVRFTVAIKNSTARALDLSDTVVNAYYGSQGTPADALEKPGGRAFPAEVAAGRTATGVFVFRVPKSGRSKVQITVDTSTRNPVVAFTGRVP